MPAYGIPKSARNAGQSFDYVFSTIKRLMRKIRYWGIYCRIVGHARGVSSYWTLNKTAVGPLLIQIVHPARECSRCFAYIGNDTID